MATENLDKEFKKSKENITDTINDYLKKSEASGCTYDDFFFNKYLNKTIKENVNNSGNLSDEQKEQLTSQLTAWANVNMIDKYYKSLNDSPRTPNNRLVPNEMPSKEKIKEQKNALRKTKDQLLDIMTEIIQEDTSKNESFTEEQFVNQVKARFNTILLETEDNDTVVYLRSYIDPWLNEAAIDRYNNALKNAENPATTKPKKKKKITRERPLPWYANAYKTFSGTDMACIVSMPLPDGSSVSIFAGELQTITYSIYDEKTPIRCLGDMNAKGYVFGPRTVAGTMIFNVFNRHWSVELMEEYEKARKQKPHWLVDEIPPINMTIACANEYGQRARLAIYGITFVTEGQAMSVNDMYVENTYQFYALDVEYLQPDGVASAGTETVEVEIEEEEIPKMTIEMEYLNDVTNHSSTEGEPNFDNDEDVIDPENYSSTEGKPNFWEEDEAKPAEEEKKEETPPQPVSENKIINPNDIHDINDIKKEDLPNMTLDDVKRIANETYTDYEKEIKNAGLSPTVTQRALEKKKLDCDQAIKEARAYYDSQKPKTTTPVSTNNTTPESWYEYSDWLHSPEGIQKVKSAYEEAAKKADIKPGDYVVMDFDETIGDNTAFELSGDTSYPALKASWANMQSDPMPGAVDFIKNVKNRGAKVVVVTGRASAKDGNPGYEWTVERDLKSFGVSVDDIICCDSGKNKPAIFNKIAEQGRIVVTAGDKAVDHVEGAIQIHTPNEYYGGYTKDEVGVY